MQTHGQLLIVKSWNADDTFGNLFRTVFANECSLQFTVFYNNLDAIKEQLKHPLFFIK